MCSLHDRWLCPNSCINPLGGQAAAALVSVPTLRAPIRGKPIVSAQAGTPIQGKTRQPPITSFPRRREPRFRARPANPPLRRSRAGGNPDSGQDPSTLHYVVPAQAGTSIQGKTRQPSITSFPRRREPRRAASQRPSYEQISSYRSLHDGLASSINRIFQSRFHFLSRFSRVMALSMLS